MKASRTLYSKFWILSKTTRFTKLGPEQEKKKKGTRKRTSRSSSGVFPYLIRAKHGHHQSIPLVWQPYWSQPALCATILTDTTGSLCFPWNSSLTCSEVIGASSFSAQDSPLLLAFLFFKNMSNISLCRGREEKTFCSILKWSDSHHTREIQKPFIQSLYHHQNSDDKTIPVSLQNKWACLLMKLSE